MSQQGIHAHVFPSQNVHAQFQRHHSAVHQRTGAVGKAERSVGQANHHGAAFLHAGDRLAGKIAVVQHPAAVRFAFHGSVEQGGVYVALLDFKPCCACKAIEHIRPCVDVAGTVIAVNHGHRLAGGGRDHVDLRVDLAQGLFQHDHGEYGRASGHIARTDGHAVGGGHARARVAFRRAERNSRFQLAGGIQQLRAFFCQRTRVLARIQHLRQNLPQLPAKMQGVDLFIESIRHVAVIIQFIAVDGEHAGSVSHAQHLPARQLPVNVPGQRGQEGHVFDMGFFIQNSLIQMSDAPALGYVELKQLGQILGSFRRHGIAPGAERGQQLALRVKRQITVHHGG